MDHTPCFPQLRAWLGRRAPPPRPGTPSELEQCFGAVLSPTLFPKTGRGPGSRVRLFTPWRTFLGLLWQCLQPGSSGREVVRHLQAALGPEGPRCSAADGAYFRARGRLPQAGLERALRDSAAAVERQVPAGLAGLGGRALKAVDGTTAILPDTAANRAAFPAVHAAPPCFPLLRLVAIFSLASGALLAAAHGNLRQSELALLTTLAGHLAKGDILVGDRGFGCYALLGWLQGLGVDFIGRASSTRRLDARRRRRRLGQGEWLADWSRPRERAPWLGLAHWAGLPATLTVRIIRVRLVGRGRRTRELTVITTLLDPAVYPAAEILAAYQRRWRLELAFDDLKTTLQTAMLRGRSPHAVRQELLARLIAHNLVRWTMAQAARGHDVPLQQLSFKGTLDALRHFAPAAARSVSAPARRRQWLELLRLLAADLVPPRPGRREPRARKRQHNKYPRLSHARAHFRDRKKSSRQRPRLK